MGGGREHGLLVTTLHAARGALVSAGVVENPSPMTKRSGSDDEASDDAAAGPDRQSSSSAVVRPARPSGAALRVPNSWVIGEDV